MQEIKRGHLGDVAVLLSAAFVIGGYCYFVSRHRLLWSDELFGWMLVNDPSWRHMWRAWNLGADGGGIGFYSLCRMWLMFFGHHVLSFRLFSAAGLFLGFVATWFSLRRFYQPTLAFVALVTVWFGSRSLLWHALQARFYGLLIGMVASALWISIRSAADFEREQKQRWSTLLLALAINLVLVSTHPFGLLYSVLLLLAAAVCDMIVCRWRPLFYVAAMISWVVLIFSRTAMANSARVGKPWFYTTRPNLIDLWFAYCPDFLHPTLYVVLCLLLAVLALLFWPRERARIVSGIVSRRDLLLPAAVLFLVPVLFWVGSQHGTSYFLDRYFSPFAIGVVVLGAELLSVLYCRTLEDYEPLAMVLTGAMLTFIVCTDWTWCMKPFADLLIYPPRGDLAGGLADMLPRDLPIVVQRADIFSVTQYYRGSPDLQLYTPLDWPLALSSESPKWLVSATHEMENWRLAGYYPDHVVDSESFLRTHRHFVVVADELDPWFHERIATQPGWQVHNLGYLNKGPWAVTIWDVVHQKVNETVPRH